MAIKIIQHKQTPKELAYHFKCGCGCEFWSDSGFGRCFGCEVIKCDFILSNTMSRMRQSCSRVESYDEPVLREEIFDD